MWSAFKILICVFIAVILAEVQLPIAVTAQDVQCTPPSKIAKVPASIALKGCQGVAKYFGFKEEEVVEVNPERKACVSDRMTVCLPPKGHEQETCVKKYRVQSSTDNCAAIAARQR